MINKLSTTILGLGLCAFATAQQALQTQEELCVGKVVKQKPVSFTSLKSLTAIWGAEASTGTADGQFQNAFVNSTTASNYDPNSWTAVSISQSDGAVAPGAAYWVRSTTGESQGAFWGTRPPIASPTQSNGVALFDSDFMDNGGIPNNFGGGSAPGAQHGWLVSPRIDLSGYTDSILAAKFYAYYRNFQVTDFAIDFSTDDGVTWTSANIMDFLPTPVNGENQNWVYANFGNATVGAVNLTQCRVRFRMNAYYYFGMIDDLTLTIAPAKDLTIQQADPSAGNLVGDYEQVQITNNRFVPLIGLSDPHSAYFGANIKNWGHENVEPSDGAELHVNIEQDNGGSWTSVHMDTIAIDSVYVGISYVALSSLSTLGWAEVGDYRVTYTASLSSDEVLFNNSIQHFFTITNDYASKVPSDTLGEPTGNGRVYPGLQPGNTINVFEMGSGFNFPNAGTEGIIVDSISTQVYVPTDYNGGLWFSPNEQVVQVRLYRFNDSNFNGIIDDQMELEVVALGQDTAKNLSSQLGAYISLSLEITDVNTVTSGYSLQDNEIYYAAIRMSSQALGEANNMPWIATYSNKNYALNLGQTNVTSNYVYTDVWANGGGVPVSSDLNFIGFGADQVPVLGLKLSGACSPMQVDFGDSTSFLNVAFSDSTVAVDPLVSWSWDFGDGNVSTDQNPSHTYGSPGTYTVCLTVDDGCQTLQHCETITVVCQDPTASFNANGTSLTVDFTDNTTTASTVNTWLWDFGDGFLSTLENPTHTFNAPGSYVVCLTVTDDCSTQTFCDTVEVTNSGVGLDEDWLAQVKVFPVPAKNELYVANIPPGEGYTIELRNMLGQVIYTEDVLNQPKLTIPVADFAAGYYNLVIVSDKAHGTVRIILE